MFRLIFLLLVIAVVGAYFTKPDQAAHRAAAEATLNSAQDVAASNFNVLELLNLGIADLVQSGRYEDYYLASKYTVRVNDEPFMECWGAFTQVRCALVNVPAPAAT